MGVRFGAIAGRVLDEENPINFDYPSNKGLVSCWSAIAGTSFYGGPTLRDMCFTRNKRNNGTLTNGTTWSGASGRPNAFGCLKFDGSDDYVSIPTASTTFTNWTARVICMSYDVTKWNMLFGPNEYDQFDIRININNQIETANVLFNVTAVNNTIYDLAVTSDGTTLRTYIDGSAKGTGAAGSVVTSAFYLGSRFDVLGNPTYTTHGLIWHASFHSRALAASEVATLYAESVLGNPETWNWLSGRKYFGVAGAGGITGSAATTLAALTSSATGVLPIVGTSAPTLAALAASATGVLPITGAASPTLAALASSATGTLPITGASSQTLAALTSNAAGVLPIVGQAAPTLGALTSTAAGTLPITAQASITLGQLTCQAAEGGFTNAKTPAGWARRPDVGRGTKRMAERSARRPEVERGARRSRP